MDRHYWSYVLIDDVNRIANHYNIRPKYVQVQENSISIIGIDYDTNILSAITIPMWGGTINRNFDTYTRYDNIDSYKDDT